MSPVGRNGYFKNLLQEVSSPLGSSCLSEMVLHFTTYASLLCLCIFILVIQIRLFSCIFREVYCLTSSKSYLSFHLHNGLILEWIEYSSGALSSTFLLFSSSPLVKPWMYLCSLAFLYSPMREKREREGLKNLWKISPSSSFPKYLIKLTNDSHFNVK